MGENDAGARRRPTGCSTRPRQLGLEAEPSRDAQVAERVLAWFEAA